MSHSSSVCPKTTTGDLRHRATAHSPSPMSTNWALKTRNPRPVWQAVIPSRPKFDRWLVYLHFFPTTAFTLSSTMSLTIAGGASDLLRTGYTPLSRNRAGGSTCTTTTDGRRETRGSIVTLFIVMSLFSFSSFPCVVSFNSINLHTKLLTHDGSGFLRPRTVPPTLAGATIWYADPTAVPWLLRLRFSKITNILPV